MIRSVNEVVLAALIACACGSKPPPPAKPKPPDPKVIAAQLDRDMGELGEVAAKHREDCQALMVELRPLIAKMKLHVEEAKKLQSDRKLGTELHDEAQKYEGRARLRTDAIALDLGNAYIKCKRKDCPIFVDGKPVPPDPACRSEKAEELRGVIDQIPTW